MGLFGVTVNKARIVLLCFPNIFSLILLNNSLPPYSFVATTILPVRAHLRLQNLLRIVGRQVRGHFVLTAYLRPQLRFGVPHVRRKFAKFCTVRQQEVRPRSTMKTFFLFRARRRCQHLQSKCPAWHIRRGRTPLKDRRKSFPLECRQ